MEKIRKNYPDIAPAGSTFSRGVRVGNLLFIAGCTARGTDAQGGSMSEQLRGYPGPHRRNCTGRRRRSIGHRKDHNLRHQHPRLA